MPIQYLYRFWCKTCKDWELFREKPLSDDPRKCTECGCDYVATKASEVPEEKLLEQRERYKIFYKKQLNDTILGGYMLGGSILQDILSNDGWSPPEIIESDAGQKRLDEIERKKRDIEINRRNIERAKEHNEALPYKKLGRNDICLCGSKKKYKKCCIVRINKALR